jgi:hypothetical protein
MSRRFQFVQIGANRVPLRYAPIGSAQIGAFRLGKSPIKFRAFYRLGLARVLAKEDHTAPTSTAPLVAGKWASVLRRSE